VKNKRPKSSIFYDSTKKKRRKQEEIHHFQTFQKKNFSNSEKITTASTKKQAYFQKKNENIYQHRASATAIPLFIDEDDTPSRPNYTYKKSEPQKTYLYGFTNSKFIYFLATLEPKAYLVFITLIALLITEDLNQTEAKIICAFILNTADTMLTIVEQEVILNNYNQRKESRALGNALHHDLETIYAELAKIKKKLSN